MELFKKLIPWIGWIAAAAIAAYEFLSKHPIPIY